MHTTQGFMQGMQRMQELANDMARICHVTRLRQIRGVFWTLHCLCKAGNCTL